MNRITKEDVMKAIKDSNRGDENSLINTNANAIYKLIGHGSKTTIQKYLDEIRDEAKSKNKDDGDESKSLCSSLQSKVSELSFKVFKLESSNKDLEMTVVRLSSELMSVKEESRNAALGEEFHSSFQCE